MLELRRHVNLKVEADDGAEWVRAALWRGRPGDSDGLAIIVEDDRPAGVARIPLCSCGERACGNFRRQLDVSLPAADLPQLVDLVRGLPASSVTPEVDRTWDGEL